MTSALLLVVPNLVGDFMLFIDASLEDVGAVLMQDGWVIACESLKLKDPTHDLKFVVVVQSIVHWRHFLLGH